MILTLPHLDPLEYVALGILALKTFNSAVAALPKPARAGGFYAWLYAFCRDEESAVDEYISARFHVPAVTTDTTAKGN